MSTFYIDPAEEPEYAEECDAIAGLGRDGLTDEEREAGIAPMFGPPEIIDTGRGQTQES